MAKKSKSHQKHHTQPQATQPSADVTAASWRNGLLYFLTLSLALLPWLAPKNTPGPLSGGMLIMLILAGLSAPFFAYALWKNYLRIPRTVVLYLFGFLLLTTLWSSFFTFVHFRSFWGAYLYGADGLLYFALQAYVVLIICSLKLTRKELLYAAVGFVIQSSIIATQVLHEVYRVASVSHNWNIRASTPLTNPNYALSYLLLALPVGIGLVLELWKQYRKTSLIPLVQTILITLSIFFVLPQGLQTLLIPSIAKHTPSSTAPAVNQPGTSTEDFLSNPSNSERFTQWRFALDSGKSFPLHGEGAGNGRNSFFKRTPTLKDWAYPVTSELPHNESLQYFSQQGVPGLLAYILLWMALPLVLLYQSIRIKFELPWLSRAALVGILLYILFNQSSFTVPVTGIMLAATLAFVLSQQNFTYLNPKPAITRIVALSLAVAGIVISFWSFRYYQAERASFQAERVYKISPVEAEAAVDRAIDYMPYEPRYWRQKAAFVTSRFNISRASGKPDSALAQQAEELYAKSIELNPMFYRSYVARGAFHFLEATTEPEHEAAVQEMIDATLRAPYDDSLYGYIVTIIGLKPEQPSSALWKQRVVEHANKYLPTYKP